jgi:hypothetical protein
MAWGRQLLMLMFGRPKGILGRLGGVIMARVNRDAAAKMMRSSALPNECGHRKSGR